MTNSRSSEPKRPWAAIGIRAARDKRLRDNDRRVLIGLGYFANRAGVCWPSVASIEAVLGVSDNTVDRAVNRLIEFGYVRLLTPGMFKQRKGAWGYSKRYQVLWQGDEEVPTYEEVLAANPLQHPDDMIATQEATHAQGVSVANGIVTQLSVAWRKGYGQATGSPAPPVPAVELQRMAAAGVKPAWFQAYVAASIGLAGRANTKLPSFQSLAAEAIASVQTANADKGSTSER